MDKYCEESVCELLEIVLILGGFILSLEFVDVYWMRTFLLYELCNIGFSSVSIVGSNIGLILAWEELDHWESVDWMSFDVILGGIDLVELEFLVANERLG